MQIIITTRPESAAFAMSELQRYDAAVRPVKDLQAGVKLIDLPGGYKKLIEDAPPLIFVRHMFPVHFRYSEPATSEPFTQRLLHEINIPEWCAGNFSVQARGSVQAETIRELENHIKEKGFIQNDKQPDWVLSLFLHEGDLYAGISSVQANRSAWNGGARRYSKDAESGFISRAEFKLMEAIEIFGIKILPGTRALDLGAAPGGWSKVLLDAGCRVTAVDPGALDARLRKRENLTYVCATAQRFFEANEIPFDIIVNDMKTDMFESIRIMSDAAHRLAANGTAVMTLKLAKGQGLSKITKALALLQKKYRVTDTRQLFHNRDEVTVCLSAQPAF
ncbi:MAG: hypothetical protein FWE90_13325 [Defluviitaleaceae bacterium]|nr:hypothetical protein [Defluviitaleaceae bacterium]